MTTFLRVLEASAEGKPAELLYGVRQADGLAKFQDLIDRIVFEVDPGAFSVIPGSPFAYWVRRQGSICLHREPASRP